MKLSDAAIDVDKVENGAWVENLPEMDGLRIKVRGLWNSQWRKMSDKLMQAVPRNRRLNGNLDVEDRERIYNACLRETCLIDWDGLFEDDGVTPIPYSKQMAATLMNDPQYRKFREAVSTAAQNVGEKQAHELEEDAGNFSRPSDGSIAGGLN